MLLGDRDPPDSCKCKKEAEQKLWNKNQQNKISGIKTSRIKVEVDPWTLGGGDPNCKCEKVSITKTVEQKQWNKNQWNKNWWGPSDIR